MKQIIFKSTAMLLIGGLFLFSCKDKEKDADMDASTTSDNANAQSSFDDMAKVSEETLDSNSSYRLAAGGVSTSCASISVDTLNGNKVFTITFPGTVCSTDGKTRSGTITATIPIGMTYNTAGAVLKMTTTNYVVNGNQIVGQRVDSCVTSGVNAVHDITVSDISSSRSGYASITSSGSTHKWNSKRRRTLSSGGGDANISNNVYDISYNPTFGNPVISGINREGRSYTVDITSPLRVNFSCWQPGKATFPTQGVIDIKPDGKLTRTIDYGAGTCDNTITVTISGKSYTVTL